MDTLRRKKTPLNSKAVTIFWFMVIYTTVLVSGYIFLYKYMSSGTKEDNDGLPKDNK